MLSKIVEKKHPNKLVWMLFRIMPIFIVYHLRRVFRQVRILARPNATAAAASPPVIMV